MTCAKIAIVSLSLIATTSVHPYESGADWVPTAALLLIMIGALVFFISRRNK